MEKIKIVAAIVDTERLTLYKPTGETIILNQGDPRIRDIVSSAIPQLNKQNWADIELAPSANSYSNFEESSNGAVRFFRIAKEKLKKFFGVKEDIVAPVKAGHLPSLTAEKNAATSMDEFEEVMKHAVPATSAAFTESGLDKQQDIEVNGKTPNAHTSTSSTDTIIAVVGNKVIPGVEKIKSQFDRASKLGSTQGVEKFLERLGAVIHERNHSVEDLLKFMERGDLPIADDGSILIYKVLNRNDTKRNTYVDCYTGKVEQWIGAYVCMDPSMVDHNRRNECSNGLHVARRGYVGQFSGSVCTLCKLAPEDVIAVPEYDANKMRVCGYHILFELTKEQFSLVRDNRPLTDLEDGKLLLGQAMRGEHINRTHEVRIGGDNGTNVTVTNTGINTVVESTNTVEEALANPEEEAMAEAVDPKQVAQEIAVQAPAPKPVKATVAMPTEGSTRERIQKLFAIGVEQPGVAQSILDLKKKSKKGWDALGVSQEQWEAHCEVLGIEH